MDFVCFYFKEEGIYYKIGSWFAKKLKQIECRMCICDLKDVNLSGAI